MRRRFRAAALDRLRELEIEIAIEAIATMVKADPAFIPTKDERTRRWHVHTERGDYEILPTGCEWYDTRARVGGGGAIDLTMHILGPIFCGCGQAIGRSGEFRWSLSFVNPRCQLRLRLPNGFARPLRRRAPSPCESRDLRDFRSSSRTRCKSLSPRWPFFTTRCSTRLRRRYRSDLCGDPF